MDHLFDFALLVISGCSALYCWMLSRRLRSLQNLRSGMGQAMVNLTKSVSAVETNAAKLNRETAASVLELQSMIASVDAAEGKVDILLETMDRQARETWKDHRAKVDTSRQQVENARRDVEDIKNELEELMADARSLAGMMNDQLIALTSTADRVEAMGKKVEEAQKAVMDAPRPAQPKPELAPSTVSPIESLQAVAEQHHRAASVAPAQRQAAPKRAAAAEPSVADLVAASKAKQHALAKAIARAATMVAEDGGKADPRIAALAKKIAAKSGEAPAADTRRRPAVRNPFSEEPQRKAG